MLRELQDKNASAPNATVTFTTCVKDTDCEKAPLLYPGSTYIGGCCMMVDPGTPNDS